MPTDVEVVDVETSQGRIRGRVRNGIRSFKGIPFAAAPVGALRFRRPVAHSGWTGTLDADEFGDIPIQPSPEYVPAHPSSEDCLTLNVWSTDSDQAGRPVLLWVYGGGFAIGGSSVASYDGARLAAEGGVIAVTGNHRLGALGFSTLTHRGLPEASDLGVCDVIAQLEWIHREIASFGGDPARVTVIGQSSGAFMAASLLAAPAARGLFHGLVLVSGGASRLVPQDQAERLGDQLLDAVGVSEGVELLDVSAERILEAQAAIGDPDIGARNAPVPASLGVVLDGSVIERHPMAAVTEGAARDIPLLLMVTGAEVRSLRRPPERFVPESDAAIENEITSWGIDARRASEIAQSYQDPDLGLWRERILTDYIYRLPAARAALAQNRAGGRAWLAQIDEADGTPGGHGMTAALIFGTTDADPSTSRNGRLIRSAIFALATADGPDWAPFDETDGEAMMFGLHNQAVRGVFEGLLAEWEGVDRP